MAFAAELRMKLSGDMNTKLRALGRTSIEQSAKMTSSWRNTMMLMVSKFKRAMKKMVAAARTGAAKMRKALEKASKGIEKGQNRIRKGFGTMIKGAAIAAPLLLAAKAAATYEQGMAKIGTLVNKGAADIAATYGDMVNATAVNAARSAAEIQDAIFTGHSGGIGKSKAATREYLDAVSAGSVAANADFGAIGETLTKTFVAFKDNGMSLMGMMDQITTAADGSITDLAGFSSAWQQSAASAGELNLPIGESIAGLSILTSTTKSASEASTRLNALFNAFKKPSAIAREQYKKIGLDMSQAAIKNRGLQGTMSAMIEKVYAHTASEKKREIILAKVFESTEALSAFNQLAIKQSGNYTNAINIQNKAMGSTAEKQKIMSEAGLHKYNQMMQRIALSWRTFGEAAMPLLADLLEKITPIIKDTTTWMKENKTLVSWIAKLTLGLSAFVMAVGAMQMISGAIIVLKAMTAKVILFNIALWASPITWVIAGIIALVAAGIWMAYNWDIVVATFKVGLQALRVAWAAYKVYFFSVINSIVYAALWAWAKITGGEFKKPKLLENAIGEFEKEKNALIKAKNDLVDVWNKEGDLKSRKEAGARTTFASESGGGGVSRQGDDFGFNPQTVAAGGTGGYGVTDNSVTHISVQKSMDAAEMERLIGKLQKKRGRKAISKGAEGDIMRKLDILSRRGRGR